MNRNYYDPTPAELPELQFDRMTRSFHSTGRAVLDLAGVSLNNDPRNPGDTIEAEALAIWRNLMAHDLRLARQLADQKRRRLFLTVGPCNTMVYTARDGALFMLASLPSEDEARHFAEALALVYHSTHVPLCVDL